MPQLARTCLVHMRSVLTKHLLTMYGAAVRECVEANVAVSELVNPQLTAVYAASPYDSLATRGLCLFLVCQKITHPLLRRTGPQHGLLPVPPVGCVSPTRLFSAKIKEHLRLQLECLASGVEPLAQYDGCCRRGEQDCTAAVMEVVVLCKIRMSCMSW